MKILITENKYHNLIEKYILDGYPVVKNVTFTKKDVVASSNENGRKMVTKNIMVLGVISGQMTYRPSYLMTQIKNDINSMFGLDIGEYGSDWVMFLKLID